MGVSCNGPAIDSSLPGGHLKLTFRSHKDPTKIPLKVNGSHNGKRFTGLPFKASRSILQECAQKDAAINIEPKKSALMLFNFFLLFFWSGINLIDRAPNSNLVSS